MVAAFKSEIGPAQQQGGIFPGIVILQVSELPDSHSIDPSVGQ